MKLDHFSKKDNSKRKKIAKKLHNEFLSREKKKRSPVYLIVSALKFILSLESSFNELLKYNELDGTK